jgi:PAS domain S-box-containing protein
MILDLSTVAAGFVLTNLVSTVVIAFLHFENRRRYRGTDLWVMNYLFQTISVILVTLHGSIPAWISIDLSGILSLAGALLGYLGLQKFTGLKLKQIHNYLLLILFILVHAWLTFIKPSLSLRYFNMSVGGTILFFQAFVLLVFRVPHDARKSTVMPAINYLIFTLIGIFRIIRFLIYMDQPQDNFLVDKIEPYVFIAYQVNILALTYSVVLMYDKTALSDISFEEEKYAKLFNTSPHGIILSRLSDGRIIEVNAGFKEITGYTGEDIEMNTTLELLWQNTTQRENVLETLKKEGRISGYELLMRRKGGNFNSLYSATLIKIQQVDHILASISDISGLKQTEEELNRLNAGLEKRVAERTAQLEELYREIEAFSYSVSHDLRAPLRVIHGFTQMFREEYGDKIDEEGRRIFSVIDSSAIRMGTLIEDLLALSKIGRKELAMTRIDMKSLAEQVVSEQAYYSPELIHHVEVKDMPDAEGDPGTVKIVFSNLLSNAIKYSSKNPKPRIEIGSFLKDNVPVYYVRDNGVGFNMQYNEKLFRVFQRLHSNKEYEGNGIGLAIVERVIRRHKGKVWAEAEPDKGALFCFTLNPGNDSMPGPAAYTEKEIRETL